MDNNQLAELIEQPSLHKRLLGKFSKAYSLGVGRDPDQPSQSALVVQVEGEEAPNIPAEIDVAGEKVRVITRTGLKAPRPLPAVASNR
jgi:hypothetical protein